jgi:hypothetical protein
MNVAILGVQFAQVAVMLVSAAFVLLSGSLLALLLMRWADRSRRPGARLVLEPAVVQRDPVARVRRAAGSMAPMPSRAPPTLQDRRRAISEGFVASE